MSRRAPRFVGLLMLFAASAPLAATAAPPAGLRAGDLAFFSLPCHACDLIERTTRSEYSHVAIVTGAAEAPTERPADGRWQVVMAAAPRVGRADLDFIAARSRRPAVYLRLRGGDSARAISSAAARQASLAVGRAYDADFVIGEDKLYCSELVYFAFKRAAEGEPVFELQPMDFRPFEAEWARELGHAPPQGEPGLSPGAVSRSSRLERVAD